MPRREEGKVAEARRCQNFLFNLFLFPSFIHSFILETYIAPLQDTTTQRSSQPSHGQRRKTSGKCKIWKGGSSARNAAQWGDHPMPMGPQLIYLTPTCPAFHQPKILPTIVPAQCLLSVPPTTCTYV